MVVWVSCVVLLCSVPVLFKRRQYLQSFLGQKGCPLFLFFPPCWVVGWGILVLVFGVGMLMGGVLVTKSSILVCRAARGTMGVVTSVAGVTYSGSTSSSPGILFTLALQSKSLRFLGRL